MGWILPPGGVPELANTIARNLYGKPPKELTPPEQDVVVAWIAGRAPVTEAEVRRDLLKDWTAHNDDAGPKLDAHNGGAAPVSQAVQTRSVAASALGVRLAANTSSKPSSASPSSSSSAPASFVAEKPNITLWEGASHLDDAGSFGTLAKPAAMPGVGTVREVKFVLSGAGAQAVSPAVGLSFMNTNAYEAHAAFVKGALGVDVDLAAFNAMAYFDPARDVVCGSVVQIDREASSTGPGPGSTGPRYALQFLPTDPMTPALVQAAYDAVLARAPFLKGQLAFLPVGAGQEETAQALVTAGSEIAVTSSDAILGDVAFSPLNQGVGYGVLRLIDGSDPRPPTTRDVVIFPRLPNDLSHTAGVITLDPQTPLSHVNLKAKQNGTPNAFIKGADELRDLKNLLGQVVRYEVTADGYSVRAATTAEQEAHLEALRPKTVTTPPRDLSVTAPAPLSSLGLQDLPAFGAKSVNAAELMRVLPAEARLDGQAVPFASYHRFMQESGLYDVARAMIAEPRFQADETYRHATLKRFRRQLRDTPVPEALRQQLKDLEASFPAGSALRLRSSTNNEDLPGFNGAGLYSSRTWDPSAQTATTAQKADFVDVMKDVWSSLWSFRAFEERSFYRIDHFATAMGVLVHPSYDNTGGAGVAVTRNIYDPKAPAHYVNVAAKDDMVTSPEDGVVPEELLLRRDARDQSVVPQTLRHANTADGAPVLDRALTTELADHLDAIEGHFRRLHGAQADDAFAMDVEFIVDHGRIRVVQARPWVE